MATCKTSEKVIYSGSTIPYLPYPDLATHTVFVLFVWVFRYLCNPDCDGHGRETEDYSCSEQLILYTCWKSQAYISKPKLNQMLSVGATTSQMMNASFYEILVNISFFLSTKMKNMHFVYVMWYRGGLLVDATWLIFCLSWQQRQKTKGGEDERSNRLMETFPDRAAEWLTGPAWRVLCVGAEVLDGYITGPDWVFLPTHLHCPPVVQRSACLPNEKKTTLIPVLKTNDGHS